MKIFRIFLSLGLLSLLFLASCSQDMDTDAKQAAQYRCEMDKVESEKTSATGDKQLELSKKFNELLDKMNAIRKTYMQNTDKEQRLKFDELFDKYKTECRGK
jgi:ABC-type glycerol-3-phosphate transport system substrate-binding protein